MTIRGAVALLVAAGAASACGTGESARKGLGEFCASRAECLAERSCILMVEGRQAVCGEFCTVGSDGCESRAYPDAFCFGDAGVDAGVCVVPCTADERCPGDLVCGGVGHCVPPVSGGWTTFAGPLASETDKVDILVMVDNSGSMAEEQTELARRFPEVLRYLLDPPDDDGDTRPDHAPVEDLNLGVVSSDMGTAGYTVSTCRIPAGGDDGCFRRDGSPAVPGCAVSYPPYLFRNGDNAAVYPVDRMAFDFSCVATLGTNGCGFEQQLESTRKALIENQVAGRCNAGFLRPDSIVVILWVTDENDCSVDPGHPEMFDSERRDLGHMSVRCFLHPDYVSTVEDYDASFRALRPSDPGKVILGMIVGVPPDSPACNGYGDEIGGCLSLPEMEERMNAGGDGVVPSCNVLAMGVAYPPVRFVQLARRWGENAVVGSICQADWTDTMDAISGRVAARLPGACFPAASLPFDAGRCSVPSCRIVERLSDGRACPADPLCTCGASGCTDVGTGAPCEPLKRDDGTVSDGGVQRRRCIVRQAARTPGAGTCSAPANEGWYWVPASMSPAGCDQLVLDAASRSLAEPSSSVYVECGEIP